jgi:1,4-alpha-glucan branching enzyme
VEVLFATAAGYIADDEDGKDRNRPAVSLRRTTGGIWESDPVVDFAANVGGPYMFRIKNAQGQTTYRTDIYSRWQIGRGSVDPSTDAWDHDPAMLDGRVGCSVVIDQDVVRDEFEPTSSPAVTIGDDPFWRDEFTLGVPVPNRVEDLVIYELHIGALGFGRPDTHVVAFDDTIRYAVRKSGGWKSTLLGGEGLVTDFTGPGRLWLQTRNSSELVSWLAVRMPSQRDSSS